MFQVILVVDPFIDPFNDRILLACIKYLGNFPCPRCSLPKQQISELGTKNDKKRREKLARVDNERRRDTVELAREWIFQKGVNVKSKPLQRLLDPKGWTPTRVRSLNLHKPPTNRFQISIQNAFSNKLSMHGFNFYSMFVPDLLHEFELGVWKACFAHLMRILYAEGSDAINLLNSR